MEILKECELSILFNGAPNFQSSPSACIAELLSIGSIDGRLRWRSIEDRWRNEYVTDIEQVKGSIIRRQQARQVIASCLVYTAETLVSSIQQRIVPGSHLVSVKKKRTEFTRRRIDHEMRSIRFIERLVCVC
jgi:hypothetical protein